MVGCLPSMDKNPGFKTQCNSLAIHTHKDLENVHNKVKYIVWQKAMGWEGVIILGRLF